MVNFLSTLENVIRNYVGVPLSQEIVHSMNVDLLEEVRNVIELNQNLQSNDGALIALNLAFNKFSINSLCIEDKIIEYKETPGLIYILSNLGNNIALVFDSSLSKIDVRSYK